MCICVYICVCVCVCSISHIYISLGPFMNIYIEHSELSPSYISQAFSQVGVMDLLNKPGQFDIHRQKQSKVKHSHFKLHNIS